MKKRFFIYVMAAILTVCAKAQTLSPSVLSASGGYSVTPNFSVSFTIAEMTMVQTFTSANTILTQGFQQPDYLLTSISVITKENDNEQMKANILPNPTKGNFTLSYESSENAETTIKIYNLVGQAIMIRTVKQTSGRNTVNFDISNYGQGIYVLELNQVNTKGVNKTEYKKINLIN